MKHGKKTRKVVKSSEMEAITRYRMPDMSKGTDQRINCLDPKRLIFTHASFDLKDLGKRIP
ncbi:hypothetical protein [Rossellomorea sp. DA94]|uniref:hypothetical protein n=1 Tax=Rossellomorea sp. DA94 TaxID=3038653 RepID=UPI00244BBC2D|nr:hypothetical protein [Rossellomorea sp. DA94]WGG46734.1 hypothetical protein P8596_05800 [Rossellomorea sp. DA94]